MNDATLTQLKILVERAVRPVRAMASRKRKMREELLAHASAVFEEEAKTGDEASALAKTRERIGDVALLTRQLEESVPSRERPHYYLERFAGYGRRESVIRRALRFAALIGAACMIALMFLIPMVSNGDWQQWSTLARLPSILAPVFMAALVFFGTILTHAMRRALYGPGGRNWPLVIAVAAAAWLLVPGFTMAWSGALSGSFVAAFEDSWVLLLTGALAPLALLIFVPMAESEIRYEIEWAKLDLDGASGAIA